MVKAYRVPSVGSNLYGISGHSFVVVKQFQIDLKQLVTVVICGYDLHALGPASLVVSPGQVCVSVS